MKKILQISSIIITLLTLACAEEWKTQKDIRPSQTKGVQENLSGSVQTQIRISGSSNNSPRVHLSGLAPPPHVSGG